MVDAEARLRIPVAIASLAIGLVLGAGAWLQGGDAFRDLDDPPIFGLVDSMVLDAGEWPLYEIVAAIRAAAKPFGLAQCCSENEFQHF